MDCSWSQRSAASIFLYMQPCCGGEGGEGGTKEAGVGRRRAGRAGRPASGPAGGQRDVGSGALEATGRPFYNGCSFHSRSFRSSRLDGHDVEVHDAGRQVRPGARLGRGWRERRADGGVLVQKVLLDDLQQCFE